MILISKSHSPWLPTNSNYSAARLPFLTLSLGLILATLFSFLFLQTQSSGLEWAITSTLCQSANMACSAELFPIWIFFSFTDHFTFYWPHFLCRFAYTALDSESLEERPVSTLLSAIKTRLLARKYQQLWDGNTANSRMEILGTLSWDYQQPWNGNTSNPEMKTLKFRQLEVPAPWNLRNQHEKGVCWTQHIYPGHSVKDSPKDVTSDNSWQNVLWTRHMRDPDQE